MSAAENLVGLSLAGTRNRRVWTVTEQLPSIPSQTPGQFSVAYRCEDQDGRKAFLKASDLSKVASAAGGTIVERIMMATGAHSFESQILDRCHGNSMDRIVTALDSGEMQRPSDGNMDVLFFLVFELAQGDLRRRVQKQAELDLVWIVTALRNMAVAVNQLHRGAIFHNDLKPANALIFTDEIQKIADLGRATTPHIVAVHDGVLCAGDRRYAPPEQLYPSPPFEITLDKYQKAQCGDLYNLGSLAHYLLTARNVTPEVVAMLRPEYRPPWLETGGWRDSFRTVLPHWRSSFSDVMVLVEDSLPENCSDALRQGFLAIKRIVEELCEPDPVLRGDPTLRGRPNQYSLERYISALDLQRSRLLIKTKQ